MKSKKINDDVEKNLISTFEQIKNIVKNDEGISRAGLMLGLQEIGGDINGFIGAYYPVASNIIIMNKTPIRRIIETNPDILPAYNFHILLHEYIHSLGFLNELITREKTYDISLKNFGENHLITQFSTNIQKFLPNLIYPIHGYLPQNLKSKIEIISGFDKSNTDFYIT